MKMKTNDDRIHMLLLLLLLIVAMVLVTYSLHAISTRNDISHRAIQISIVVNDSLQAFSLNGRVQMVKQIDFKSWLKTFHSLLHPLFTLFHFTLCFSHFTRSALKHSTMMAIVIVFKHKIQMCWIFEWVFN